MKQKKLLLSLAFALMSMAGHAADNLPNLRVKGKNLADSEGKTVVLHGVMIRLTVISMVTVGELVVIMPVM